MKRIAGQSARRDLRFPFILKLTPLSSIVTTNVLSSMSTSRLIGLLNFIEDSLRISSKEEMDHKVPTLGNLYSIWRAGVCPQQSAGCYTTWSASRLLIFGRNS